MHNKVYLVDNSQLIIGGRNIANEYFDFNSDKNFRDLDVLAVGPAAKMFGKIFDQYWNSAASYPVNEKGQDFAVQNHVAWLTQRQSLQLTSQDELQWKGMEKAAALPWINSHLERLLWAPARVMAGSPNLVHDEDAETLADQLESVPQAKKELLIESAYFIPSEPFMKHLALLSKQGVRIKILTNSMRSNDVLAAHASYAKRRQEILEAGAELYEWRSDSEPVKRKGVYASRANLHTKAYIVDREYAFVGSYNMDPRSTELNTESGIVIRSGELAQTIARFIEEGMQPTNSWKLSLHCATHECNKKESQLHWDGVRKNNAVSFDKEPDSTFWQRVKVKILGWLPIDHML